MKEKIAYYSISIVLIRHSCNSTAVPYGLIYLDVTCSQQPALRETQVRRGGDPQDSQGIEAPGRRWGWGEAGLAHLSCWARAPDPPAIGSIPPGTRGGSRWALEAYGGFPHGQYARSLRERGALRAADCFMKLQ